MNTFRDYPKLLNQLKSGHLKELKVTPDHFMDFQKALMAFPDQHQIVGKAYRGGQLVYHYQHD